MNISLEDDLTGGQDDRRTFTDMPIAICNYIDLPGDGVDCSEYDQAECIRCGFPGIYFTAERLNDTKSLGDIICLLIWVMTVIIGIFAIFGNLTIIVVLKRKNSGRPFDVFLIGLAIFDLICSVFAIVGTTASIVYFQNWSRGVVTLYFIVIGATAHIGRSGSAFLTVGITIERFLIVTFPESFSTWFTVRKTQVIIVLVWIWAILLSIPFLSVAIVPNKMGKDIPSISSLDYIFLETALYDFWYSGNVGLIFDMIDFWTPFPLLLIFNCLIYYQIKKFATRRKLLKKKHQKDIRMAKMFFPVVFILFLCNIVPIVNTYFTTNGVLSRELGLGAVLSFTVNSAVNLPIYYFGGSSFQKETRKLLSEYFPFFQKDGVNNIDTPNVSVSYSTTSKNKHKVNGSTAGDKSDAILETCQTPEKTNP